MSVCQVEGVMLPSREMQPEDEQRAQTCKSYHMGPGSVAYIPRGMVSQAKPLSSQVVYVMIVLTKVVSWLDLWNVILEGVDQWPQVQASVPLPPKLQHSDLWWPRQMSVLDVLRGIVSVSAERDVWELRASVPLWLLDAVHDATSRRSMWSIVTPFYP